MSIFDNVRTKPADTGIHLLLKLKYGEPTYKDDWLDQLPEAVIKAAASKVNYHHRDPKLYLKIMLRQPINVGAATAAINEALVEYHTLLGSV